MSKNEKIKKIINFKYIKKGKDTLQKKAVKALFAFLVLMIGCTMLSRAADSMTIPRIKVDTPKSKTIVDEVKAKGVVAKNREEKISVVEGLKIDYVNISVGSSIKVVDTLVELDKDDYSVEKYDNTGRQRPAKKSGVDKLSFRSDAGVFTEEQVKKETARCLGCGATIVDENQCVGCGICTTKCEFDAIHLQRDLPECSTMRRSEDKLKYILPYGAKQAIKIKFKKKKD